MVTFACTLNACETLGNNNVQVPLTRTCILHSPKPIQCYCPMKWISSLTDFGYLQLYKTAGAVNALIVFRRQSLVFNLPKWKNSKYSIQLKYVKNANLSRYCKWNWNLNFPFPFSIRKLYWDKDYENTFRTAKLKWFDFGRNV